jgi:hypothetical protein
MAIAAGASTRLAAVTGGTTNNDPTEKAAAKGIASGLLRGQRINLRGFLGNFKIERI